MTQETKKPHGKSVLLVDDDMAQRLLMESALEKLDVQIIMAKDGREALDAFRKYQPDLVLMDIKMPVMDGLEACEAMRKVEGDAGDANTPIVLITGSDDVDSINKAFDLDATDFITKPVIWPILSHRVRYMLKASQAFKRLRINERRLSRTQKIAAIGNWEWDLKTQNIELSDYMFRMLKISASDFDGTSSSFLKIITNSGGEKLKELIEQAASDGTPWALDHSIVLSDGFELMVHHQGEVKYNEEGDAVSILGAVQNITRRKEAEEQVRRLAYFDSLTGLPNRMHFKQHAEQCVVEAEKSGFKMAVMFLDVDEFKRINDTLGHCAGDILLKHIGGVLKGCIRESDSVMAVDNGSASSRMLSRLGGDEFTVLLSQITDHAEVQAIGKRLLIELAKPVEIMGQEIVVTGSLGVAVYPDDGMDVGTLMRFADIAMYQSKAKGKNTLSFYSDVCANYSEDQLNMESRLRKAIENEELFLVYQPQIDSVNGSVGGVEALVRWQDPERGMIQPSQFIPLAEKTGLIVSIGAWVLRQACQQAKVWERTYSKSILIGVNISVVQFQKLDFVDDVLAALTESGLPPSSLNLELTESMLMKEADQGVAKLTKLKATGIQISIDDFGTGYSSMSYLKLLPLNHLKIDRSFVSGIQNQGADQSIVTAIITLAHSLKLTAIAEGVETQEQLEFLTKYGCDLVQGYLYSKPISAEEFEHQYLTQTSVCKVIPLVK